MSFLPNCAYSLDIFQLLLSLTVTLLGLYYFVLVPANQIQGSNALIALVVVHFFQMCVFISLVSIMSSLDDIMLFKVFGSHLK